MHYECCDQQRRHVLQGHPTLNGIDFLEVIDNPGDPLPIRQTQLDVWLINDLPTAYLTTNRMGAVIEGGDRIRPVAVTNLTVPDPTNLRLLRVTVDKAGDFSTYTLRLTLDLTEPPLLPAGPSLFLDPILKAISFSFKADCPSEFDCLSTTPQLPPAGPNTAINYLAKDYATFRQLMLDRLALLIPDWTERNPADTGVALVELLAYVGDYLSYQQDATATEAYLNTARLRTSVHRHARLVDYTMHDGCNARVWVQVLVSADRALPRLSTVGTPTQFLTQPPGQLLPAYLTTHTLDYGQALHDGAEVFEIMPNSSGNLVYDSIPLFADHNELLFYTWGNMDCCLPAGTTSATLLGHYPNLAQGQVLILAEVIGPRTGLTNDADPAHRHAVLLTNVGPPATDPLFGQAITEISWHATDALPFGLCLSATQGTRSLTHINRGFGNIVLADYGRTLIDQPLLPDTVPPSTLTRPSLPAAHCEPTAPVPIPARYRPRLGTGPITQAATYDPASPPASARDTMRWSLTDARPALWLREVNTPNRTNWIPSRDLLNSQKTDTNVVVETETDGTAYLRFGDGTLGARPTAGTSFQATYRVGNGPGGNIGADTLACVATYDLLDGFITGVRNWLPAVGGVASETIEEVRQKAPYAFRRQERAVVPADYEMLARTADLSVQRTACTFRWTGSWRTAFLSVDRLGGEPVDEEFRMTFRDRMERYRMAGYDLSVDEPRPVSLEIEMVVCVERGYFAVDVKKALLRVFTRYYQPDGQRGLFHPDRFTFGQTVYLSPFYAAAQAVPGVSSVQITVFRRQGDVDTTALEAGKITLARLEIARLDNDPNFPDRGTFKLIMQGGK